MHGQPSVLPLQQTYLLNKDPGKRKFDQRTKMGIFIGYSDISKAYKVWLPNERKLVVSRDIRVLEDDYNHENKRHNHEEDESLRSGTIPLNFMPNSTEMQVRTDYLVVEIPETPNVEEEEREEETMETHQRQCRAPGRPKIIRTGRRGRPRKLYQTRIMEPNVEEGTAERDGNENASVDTEETEAEGQPDGMEDQEDNFVSQQVAGIAEISVRDALNGENELEWKHAIKTEITNLIRNNTFKIVERPENKKVVDSRIVLTNKFKADGSLEKRKARVVARGFAQRPGIDFYETFAPVARLETIRLLLALAVRMNMTVEQVDVTGAYLNGNLREEIFMEMPDQLKNCLQEIAEDRKETTQIKETARNLLKQINRNNDGVCRLTKAIYGLRQAGRQWHEKLSLKLKSLGLQATVADPCLYHGKQENDRLY